MNKFVKGGLAVTGVGVVLVGGLAAYVLTSANARLTAEWKLAPKEFPIPRALTDAETSALAQERLDAWRAERTAACAEDAACLTALAAETPPDPLAGVDLAAVAKERAIARGEALINGRLGCFDCHGEDYGGKVVVEIPPVMGMIAPNITNGGIGKEMTDGEWVLLLRHGIGRDRQASLMPAIDYTALSDEEIGDIATFIRSRPPVERTMPPAYMGPVLKAQMVFGGVKTSVEQIDHSAERPAVPPPAAADVTFGGHVAQVCTGCHGKNFTGGPIIGGDPSWPEAANLTPHESGLKGWTLADFNKAMTEGKRPDGSEVKAPMPWQFYGKMPEVDREALFVFLQSLPPTEKGKR